MKKAHLLILAMLLVGLSACSHETPELNEGQSLDQATSPGQDEFPSNSPELHQPEFLDMSGYDFTEASALKKGDGCGDEVAVAKKGIEPCCYIHDITYYGPPQWQPQITRTISGPYAWEATDWFLRHTIIDNSSGNVILDGYSNDLSYDLGLTCDDNIQGAIFLGPPFGPSVGPNCPNDFTYILGRYYEWLDSGVLYECCSKSLDIQLPTDPNADPCA